MKLITLLLMNFLFVGTNACDSAVTTPRTTSTEINNIKDGDPLDVLMRSFLIKTKLPGVSITINMEGDTMYSKAYGFADVENHIKMRPTNQIRTASVAKVITATALGKLATEGKLDFDKPIKEYVSYIPAQYADLTIRQIAGHTAGVPHRPSSNSVKKKHYTSARETVEFLKKDDLLFEPDTKYQYSSLGYNLLAAVIEEISGKNFADYMREDIFNQLGMSQTFPDEKSKFGKDDAKMYYIKNGKLYLDKKIQDGSYKLAGAGFRSTSVDLAKMMIAYSNGFLSKRVVDDMFKNNKLKNGKETNVGIGWRLNKDINGRPTIEHAGSWQGARTVIVYYPKEKLTISIMINSKCTVFIEETAHIIAQLFLNKQNNFELDASDFNQVLDIQNNRSNGTVENYQGQLTFKTSLKGKLTIETDKEWLKTNDFYYVSSNKNFALSTRYGLMHLTIETLPKLEGKLYQYQTLSDLYHMDQKPMLKFRRKN